ncbi:anaerobic ribonucleoside-triphosphate reductase, partial [Arthrospira platensis SPKY2]
LEFIEIYNKCLNIYGPNVLKENGVDPKSLNILSFMDRFFENQEDISEITVDSNSNTIYSSITNFKNEAPKSLHKLFSLYRLHKKIKELYSLKDANNCIESILNGNLFFNDLSKGIYPYCYAFDIGKLITKGMDFYKGNGSIFIKPPKRSSTFLQQLIQTTSFASNQISGAVSYPSLFVILDYFYRLQFGEDYINELRDKSNKKLTYFIHNEFQSIIFSFNTPCRDGGESSFVNLSIMDTGFLENLFKDYVIKIEDDIIYKPNIYNVLELSKEFFEYFSEINSKESLFTFPVITLAISIDENGNYIDPDFVDWVSIHNSKKALGNIFQAPPYKYSTCCRLISDYSQLEYVNSFGVGGLEIGSTRVCGLNLPRIALQENQDLYLNERLKEVRYILTAHRNIVDELIHKGNLPLYTYDWINVNKQYSTVGFIGAYEFVINSGFDLFSEQGKNSLLNLLQSIGNTISSWNKESNFRFNIEQIPGESMAIRMLILTAY